jgi:hypothetical protein
MELFGLTFILPAIVIVIDHQLGHAAVHCDILAGEKTAFFIAEKPIFP